MTVTIHGTPVSDLTPAEIEPWRAVPVAIALTAWFWPRKDETAEHLELERAPP